MTSLEPPVAGGHALSLPPASLNLDVDHCTICGGALGDLSEDENCPHCGSPARTRSLAPIISSVIVPLLSRTEINRSLPLLAFAMTIPEQRLLEPTFPTITSASLYGTYASDHEEGVDARDLARYANGSFSGVFSILVWDYFTEHERALRETYRVLAPGGVFFTLIAGYRLTDGNDAPWVFKEITPRPGYLEYVPADTTLPSIKLGRSWLVDAMRRTGFAADLVSVRDTASGVTLDWFIGQRGETDLSSTWTPLSDGFVPGVRKTAMPPAPKSMTRAPVAPRPVVVSRVETQSFTRTYSTPVDPAFGFDLVGLTLSTPTIPEDARGVDFAEHAIDATSGKATDTVIAVKKGGILLSNDLGETWEYRETPETGDVRLWNAFTLANGHHLIQGLGPTEPTDSPDDPEFQAEIFHYDQDWQFLSRAKPSISHWHGTRSIDQRGDTIMFAEYTENGTPYRADFEARREELSHLCRNSRVFRSTDDGNSWDVTFEMPWTEVRHFHTVAADPFDAGVWWLSSGDRAEESRVWRSADDGITWMDVTSKHVGLPAHPRFAGHRQSAFRYTDLAITPDALIWGSDDWLGNVRQPDEDASMANRGGARLFVAAKTVPLEPTAVAYIGNPVRSIIDVGPCYLVATQAKYAPILPRPQLYLVSKMDPSLCAEIGTIDQFTSGGTGFTYSRASRISKNGRFFSYRAYNDVFRGGPRILQWDIVFQ